jgi:biotin carboxyl carrier protein
MPDEIKAFKVKANDFEFQFNREELNAVDFIQKSPHQFHIILNNRSVNAELLEVDGIGKKLRIEVEGERFEIEIKDELDQMLDQMGFSNTSSKHLKEIKAPMPGMVINVAVKEGQQVKEGDRILILEAMKMENSIIIPADATIKRIAVKAGQPVDKGQVLVELE